MIEARGLQKSFRIPEHRIDSLKERAAHPLTRVRYRELRALRDVSFDVHRGEFVAIVGPNGSGKSTLLKILASIYRADAGRIRVAGRVAPFIELGVGFNPELTARENGVLNGVLMGLTLREARRRLDQVLEFAELEDFVELKLKNYSSGMMARFAFAVMVQADADIMLIDEVLAVGDAAFAQKCLDVFREKRRAGKTIVLVTHDMSTVQTLCHRAMLIHDGVLQYAGAPEDVALRYYRITFGQRGGGDAGEPVIDVNARVVDAGLLENLEQGAPIELDVVVEAARDLHRPIFVFHVVNDDGVVVGGFMRTLEERVASGRRVRLAGKIENPLVAGRYYLDLFIRDYGRQGDLTVQGLRLTTFVVYGTAPRTGSSRCRRTSSRCSNERAGGAGATRRSRPVGARRRPAAVARALYLIAVTDFKKHYFGTAFGYLWSLARPLMLFGVLLVVFTQVFRLGSEVQHYPVLLLLNIVLFSFFQEATGAAVTSIVAQESVVRKTQFPRVVIPLAVVLTSVFNLGPNLVAVLIFLLAFGIGPLWTWLLFPLVVAAFVVIATAVSMILASLYPSFRDMAIIWTVLSTVLFASPVLYPIDKVPDTLPGHPPAQPARITLKLARKWVIDPDAPGPIAVAGGALHLLPALAIYIVTIVVAVWVFHRTAPRIAEQLWGRPWS